jgi:hypothetical protein
MTVIGYETHRLLIVADEHAGDQVSIGFEAHTLADFEIKHRGVRAKLGEHP